MWPRVWSAELHHIHFRIGENPKAMSKFLTTLKQVTERYAPGERLTAVCLTVILLLSLVAKLMLIHGGGVQDRSILKMEYGFGPVITSLYERGSLEACGVPVALEFCGVAARMPLMPWLYASAAKIIGLQQTHLAIAKSLVATVLLWLSLLYLCRGLTKFPVRRLYLVLISALLLLGPQYLKHTISVQYEESLLIDLLPIYFCLLGGVILRYRTDSLTARDYWILACLSLMGSSLYFLKSSLLFFGLIAIFAPLFLVRTPYWAKAIAILPFVLGLFWWGHVNYAYHGQIRLGSSYNGENLYRGQNDYSYKIYPEIHLDRLIDSDVAILNSGERVPLPDWSHHFPPFQGEWEWYDYFKRLGQQWGRDNPGKALAFTLRKAYVLFLEPRKVPFRQMALPEMEPKEYSKGTLMAGLVWIILLRALFFTGIVQAARSLFKYRTMDNPSLWYFLFVGAYAAPYLIGFAYQRHITPMLMFTTVILLWLTINPAIPGKIQSRV